MQEKTVSNPRLKATNDDLFISGGDLLRGKVSKMNSETEDQEYDAITILWIKRHKYAFFLCH